MIAQSGGGWVAGATAIVGLIGAVLGVLRYFNYRTRRDRLALVGTAFEGVVDALASDSEVKRLAAAIRLRRFFDPGSEVGSGGAPYSHDAVGVIAGVLREQPSGNFQKLLADGLSYAPSLDGVDLQRTNLQGAYLGGVDACRADFYRADLSGASLKRANGREAVFYQARLVGTVFAEADLRGANFFQADLKRAQFAGAELQGATFTGSHDIPADVAAHLDEDTGPAGPLPPSEPGSSPPVQLFVSRPSMLTPSQEAMRHLVEHAVKAQGAELVTVARNQYPRVGVLSDLRRAMADCSGVVVLGFRQLEIATGLWRGDTPEEQRAEGLALATQWNQVEAGMAVALGLPVFILRESGVTGGVFDLTTDVTTVVADIDDAVAREHATPSIQTWVSALAT